MEKDNRKNPGFGFRMTGMILCVGLSMAIFTSTYANAQGAQRYPSRAMDIIVAFGAGSSNDLFARFMAGELSKRWGIPVNVLNKPGGAGVVGTHAALSAPPDGYTILLDNTASSAGQVGLKNLPYEVLNRTFLCLTVHVPELIVSAKSCPWNNLKELAEAGQKDPTTIVWGASASGRGPADIVLLQLFEAAGIDVTKARRVDFGGTGPTLNALAGGHIKLAGGSPAAVVSVVTSGVVKALCISTPDRSVLMPDVPTSREVGFPQVNFTSWKGFSGPPGLPTHVIEIFTRTVAEILKDPQVKDTIEKKFEGMPDFQGPDAFKAFVVNETKLIEKYTKLMGVGK